MWTHFWDMNSGGGVKHDVAHIYIEAPEGEAKSVFYARFGTNPERVSCTCCGEDYSIEEEPSLEEATGYQRNLPSIVPDWGTDFYALPLEDRRKVNDLTRHLEPGQDMPEGYAFSANPMPMRGDPIALEDYIASGEILVIRASEISDDERSAHVPEQGYVWQD